MNSNVLKQAVVHHQQLYQTEVNWSCPQRSRHYVVVPVIWQIWQYQMTRQHQTTLGSQDLALLDPEREDRKSVV